jgi:hypothetical protein
MFNVHITFICFCTLLLIVGHHWVELEVPLHISFAYCCSLKIEQWSYVLLLVIFIEAINSKVLV